MDLRKIDKYIDVMKDYVQFKRLAKANPRFNLSLKNRSLQLDDKIASFPFDTHYLYHPAWAARVIKEINPKEHVDISSILSFSTVLSAFVPVKFYDYRPSKIVLDNFYAGKADLVDLPFADNSIESISCLHVAEHIGLGRYGDPIDPDGDIKAINELKRVTAKQGNLIFAVPMGKPRICFNGHRIYSYEQIVELFSGFTIKQFVMIPDNALEGGMIENASPELASSQEYGCGCFWFVKE
jgi:hypothetical protein